MDLIEFGFRQVGDWHLDDTLNSGARLAITDHGDDRVIYAFVVDGDVKYIGVCDNTHTTLEDRLNRYQTMAGAGTNERIAGLIKHELESMRTVHILAWKPDFSFEFRGVTSDFVRGLEYPLINAVQPEWNIQG